MIYETKTLSRPLTAQIEITNGCNHRCVHCYLLSSDLEKRPLVESSDEVVYECAKKLVEASIFSVVVTGGEPLLKKELLKRIICLFSDNQIRVSLNTNLTLLDDKLSLFLKEKRVSVLTSCPSSNREQFNILTNTHNYLIFEQNVKKLSELGVYFTVNMVVTKDKFLSQAYKIYIRINRIGDLANIYLKIVMTVCG